MIRRILNFFRSSGGGRSAGRTTGGAGGGSSGIGAKIGSAVERFFRSRR